MRAKAAAMIEHEDIVGIIIAGGRSSRMGGGDKTLLPLGDKRIIEHVADKLAKQVNNLAINSNSPDREFARLGLPIFADTIEGYQGPLAGLLASLIWVRKNHPHAKYVVTVASDSPFFPDDLVEKLASACHDPNSIMMAESGGFNHPIFALWPISLCDDLQKWLSETGNLKVMAWVRTHAWACVDFPIVDGRDPFFNINKPEDLKAATKMLETMP